MPNDERENLAENLFSSHTRKATDKNETF